MSVERQSIQLQKEGKVVTVRQTWNRSQTCWTARVKGAVQVEACQLSEMPLADLLGKRPRVIWDILVASVRAQHRSVLQRCDFTAAKMDSFYETTLAHTRSPIPRDIIGAMMVIKSNY
jgi:hypothetical protein